MIIVKHITMDDLFRIDDVQPKYEERSSPPPDTRLPDTDVDAFYRFHFQPGLNRLFETDWYSEYGLQYLRHHRTLLDFQMQVMEQFMARDDDVDTNERLASLESRLVWQLAAMPRLASPPGVNDDAQKKDLLIRIDIVENLLTGQFLPASRVPPPPAREPKPDAHTYSQQIFWHHLGRFVSIRDDVADPATQHEVAVALHDMRGILSMLESRDVLYSLAILRHVGGRLKEFQPPKPVHPQTADPGDEVKKLQIAHDFLSQQNLQGTTQVIQRTSGMGLWSMVLQKRE